MGALERQEEVTIEEAVQLGSVDPNFFGRFFFPKACRQDAPAFHRELDAALDDPELTYVNAMIARGHAKTTKVRVYIARRIAYRISRTVLVVGKSQDAAAKTVQWLINAVERNTLYSDTFGLSRGSKWTSTECIINATTYKENGQVDEMIPITIMAVGITGSLRGINVDDFRPDLIVADDPCDEENTATSESRKKMNKLFFGALQKTLAPKIDSPFSKMVLLQTVLNKDDLVSLCHRSKMWYSLKFSCFDIDAEGKECSRWEERFPYKTLIAEKEEHIENNMLSVWLAEMECKAVSEETAAFKPEWLQFWDEQSLPKGGKRCLAIDPTPPPRDGTTELNPKLDDAVIMCMQLSKGQYYVLDYETMLSPDPYEFIMAIFTMARKWKVKLCGFETILFQRVLSAVFKRQMREERFWLTVQEIEDKRKKALRIQQEISGPANAGDIFIAPWMNKLQQQFEEFPDVNHDDVIECVAIGIMTLARYNLLDIDDDDFLEGEFEVLDPEDPHGRLGYGQGAP